MAITKTQQIKSDRHLQISIEYIMKPEKTEGGKYIYTYETVPAFASTDFLLTKNLGEWARSNHRAYKNDVYAHHIVQSFHVDDDVTADEVYQVGIETAQELTKGRHEFVVCTHTDKDHLHNHIIFNASSFYDLKKFQWRKNTARELRDISDLIIMKHGLKVVEQERWRSYTGFQRFRKQSMHRTQIKMRIDYLRSICTTKEMFEERLAQLNVKVTKKQVNYWDTKSQSYRTITLDSYRLDHPYFEGEDYLDSYFMATGKHLPKQKVNTVIYMDKKYERNQIEEHISQNQTIVEKILATHPDDYEQQKIKQWERKNGDIEYALDGHVVHGNLMKPKEEREDWLTIWERRERIIQEPIESIVEIPKEWVTKDYSEGLFVPVRYGAREGLVKFDANLVDETKDSFLVSIGSNYDFAIYANDSVDRTIKGEELIRQYETNQGVVPKAYTVKEEYIQFVSTKGIAISIPEQGIEKIFISSKDVKIDQLTGQTQIILGDNWNYRFKQVGYDEWKSMGKTVYQESIKGEILGHLVSGNEKDLQLVNEMGKSYHWKTRKARLQEAVGNLNRLTALNVNNYQELLQKLEDTIHVIDHTVSEMTRLQEDIGEFNQVQKYLKLIADNQSLFEELEEYPEHRAEIEWRNQGLLEELNYAKNYLSDRGINEYMKLDQIAAAIEQSTGFVKELEDNLKLQMQQKAFLESMKERFSKEQMHQENRRDKENDELER